MREIKFRAWDSWWGKMYYFDFTKNIEATPDDELKGLWILHEEGSVYAIQDKIKIMQYTGLKDKNEVEIYEGDILRNVDNPFVDKLPFKVVWNDYYGAWFWLALEGEDVTDHFYQSIASDCEVIGNIYDNPELMEE